MTRRSWSRGVSLWAAIALLGGATSADARLSASTTSQTGNTNSRTYVDGLGDAKPGGLDVAKVTVSNDDTGRIRFSLGIPSHDDLPAKQMIIIYLDVDRDPQTGSQQGFEFEMILYWDYSFRLSRVSGPGAWRRIPSPGVTVGGLAIEIDRSRIGNPTSFDFRATIRTYGGTEGDRAPSPGTWRYNVIVPRQTLTLTGPKTIPSSPVAGQQYSAAFRVELVRPGSPRKQIKGGEVECKATAADKRLSVDFTGFYRGLATCAWPVPSSARGSIFQGTITVRSGDMTASETFTGRVR